MKLEGRAAVITGGSKGIGLGCVRVFAKYGCQVVFGARGREEGEAVAGQLSAAGHTVLFVPTDVRLEQDIRALIGTAVERFGRLDCMVNNAGLHPPEMTVDQTRLEDFESLLRLNLTSTFLGCKLAVAHLRKTHGSIINMSSAVGLHGQGGAVSYAATKAGQLGLTYALASDLAPENVRVNAVCPAGVFTPTLESLIGLAPDPRAAMEACHHAHRLGRMATIDEIGEVCAFLASDEASFITGQVICPDGGRWLG